MSEIKTSYDQGLWAETMAALYLCLKGYKVLERRFKTPVGEIDIVARKGKTIIFAEVKFRPTSGEALAAISQTSRMRIERTAEAFIQHNPGYAQHDIRFDVLAVSGTFSVHHLDNAWIQGQ
jgi:putative endonuclease